MKRLRKRIGIVYKDPWMIYRYLSAKGMTRFIPDEKHLSILFRASMGYWPNLTNPVTFNEKLQWLKIHDRNPLYTTLVDKYAVKDWVSERIGKQYVVPTYNMWKSADTIDISMLPQRFVLKTNHDSGGIVICRDKSCFDMGGAKKKLSEHLKQNYFWGCREWPYKNVSPCIFAEEYLESDLDQDFISNYKTDKSPIGMTDYKYYCFYGEPKLLYVSQGLENHETAQISFLTLDWSFEPFSRPDYAGFKELPPRPDCLDEMIEIARELSKGIPFVRVDLYVRYGEVLFSEMTFSPCGGFMQFEPAQWDVELGKWLELPAVYN